MAFPESGWLDDPVDTPFTERPMPSATGTYVDGGTGTILLEEFEAVAQSLVLAEGGADINVRIGFDVNNEAVVEVELERFEVFGAALLDELILPFIRARCFAVPFGCTPAAALVECAGPEVAAVGYECTERDVDLVFDDSCIVIGEVVG